MTASTYTVSRTVAGPWSLAVSRTFWEGFSPAALAAAGEQGDALRTVFLSDHDWTRVETSVVQRDNEARIEVSGPGDLDAAAAQVARFLSLDVDATAWPDVARRDPVVARAQEAMPGLRPCGFHSPYEAAVWSVLAQRMRITQAAWLREQVIADHGDGGAFPTPERLRGLELDLPGRKTEYLHAVADAALDGVLDGRTLRDLDPVDAVAHVQQVKGLGPFAAELVVLRGANAPDALPRNEARVTAEIEEQYGADAVLDDVAEAWRPFRTWAVVHLRAMREQRTHEIAGTHRS